MRDPSTATSTYRRPLTWHYRVAFWICIPAALAGVYASRHELRWVGTAAFLTVCLSLSLILLDWRVTIWEELRVRWCDPERRPLYWHLIGWGAGFAAACSILYWNPHGWLDGDALTWANLRLSWRAIADTVAESCLIMLILFGVPSHAVRSIWEHRWQEYISGAAAPSVVAADDSLIRRRLWLFSIWGDVLKFAILLHILLFAESSRSFAFGFVPAACVMVGAFVYVQAIVDVICQEVHRRSPSSAEGLEGIIVSFVSRRFENRLLAIDAALWVFMVILSCPHGLVWQGLFFFSLMGLIDDFTAQTHDASREKAVMVALLPRLHRSPVRVEWPRYGGPIAILVFAGGFATVAHRLCAQYYLPAAGAGSVSLGPSGGAFYPVLTYVALLSIVIYRFSERHQEAHQRETIARKLVQGQKDAIQTAMHERNRDAGAIISSLHGSFSCMDFVERAALRLAAGVNALWLFAGERVWPLSLRAAEEPSQDGFSAQTLAEQYAWTILESVLSPVVEGGLSGDAEADWRAAAAQALCGPIGVDIDGLAGTRDSDAMSQLLDQMARGLEQHYVIWDTPAPSYRVIYCGEDTGLERRVSAKQVCAVIMSALRELMRNAITATATAGKPVLLCYVGPADGGLAVAVVNTYEPQPDVDWGKLHGGTASVDQINTTVGGVRIQLMPLEDSPVAGPVLAAIRSTRHLACLPDECSAASSELLVSGLILRLA